MSRVLGMGVPNLVRRNISASGKVDEYTVPETVVEPSGFMYTDPLMQDSMVEYWAKSNKSNMPSWSDWLAGTRETQEAFA